MKKSWAVKLSFLFFIFPQAYIPRAPQCNFHGTYKCGICECDADFFGPTCECDVNNLKFDDDLEAGCRPDNTTSVLCNNRGECVCGECACSPRENPEEEVTGDYCECDNFSCDRHNGLLVSIFGFPLFTFFAKHRFCCCCLVVVVAAATVSAACAAEALVPKTLVEIKTEHS